MPAEDPGSDHEPAAPRGPDLDEIRRILAAIPGPDLASGTAAAAREPQLLKPPGALGRLEEIAAWMATWQGRHPALVRRPRVCVFAGNHGVAAQGVSAYPASVTAQMVQATLAGQAAINQLCETIDADLRVFELNLDVPTRDFTAAPAMDAEECARAVAYGMMAVESGIDLLCVGELGIANTTTAAALCLALFGGSAADWVGPGTGVAGATLARKAQVAAAGVARHRDAIAAGDAFDALRCVGGLELAAISGAVLAARHARIPVLLDGFVATAAASVLFKADKRALDHCRAAHRSAEPGHDRLLKAIGQAPLFDLGMRLGEATGAALAVPLVRAACACHAGMGTFAEAQVDGPG
ncbi:MAG: nicotinate-nucleotide--dimethylbenzimidazole phosphoribosyltransferase [Alphaproteobacteria bacterium]|nr:nicotinate-nucleotide--dimethylbenzimidazole phosphoribosyltransferase [Alphaproteobacteria bacterium]